MARPKPTEKLEEIERAVKAHPDGLGAPEIAAALTAPVPSRTLQSRLSRLVRDGRLLRHGTGRWARYQAPAPTDAGGPPGTDAVDAVIPLSPEASEIRRLVRQPEGARQPVGYKRDFLEGYRPNESFYLGAADRTRLAAIARRPADEAQPAGTYARHILGRLLIDLAWNSSRLEGNTYSLLDTKRLIEFGQEAEGRDHLETQMILNHKDAIEFLALNATDIGFNRYTILNLHGILANNLLAARPPRDACATSASASAARSITRRKRRSSSKSILCGCWRQPLPSPIHSSRPSLRWSTCPTCSPSMT